MAKKETISAPLAIIKFNGLAIGKMKSIRLTETISRTKVVGIGTLIPSESVVTAWDGTLNCSMFLVDFKKAMNYIENGDFASGAPVLQRVASVTEFVDYLLLNTEGVTVDILRKVQDTQDPSTGIIKPKFEIFASVKNVLLTREGMDISDGQIGGRDADFQYLTPVVFTPQA